MSFISIFRAIAALVQQLVSPAKVAMIGDSIIANLATTNTQGLLHAPYDKALNLGIHGNTSTQIMARLGSIPSSVKTLLLEGGGNDVLIAIAHNTMGPAVIESIRNNYAFMLNAIPRTTRILLLGIARIDDASDHGPTANAQFALVNAQLKILAGLLPNVTFLAAAQAVNMNGLTIDGVHPSTAGYAQLFSVIP